jgi:hypothetical protein
MSDFEEEARKRQAALALLGDHGDDGYEEHAPEPHDGLMSVEEVFGEDDLDRADRAQRQAPDDSLAQKSVIRQGVWSDLHKIAPFARINPPSVLQGTLGGQQNVKPGELRQVAMWGGVDAETLPVTVTFAPVDPIPQYSSNPTQGVLRPFGVVRWGTRGFSARAEVDIHRGVQFTLNASEVELLVGLDRQFADPGTPFRLGGMLSFYPTTHRAAITRSYYIDAFDAAAGFIVDVPNFARGVMLNMIPVADTTARIDLLFETSQGTGVGGYSYPATAGGIPQLNTGFIPLSGQVAKVIVSSVGGSGDTFPFDLIFEMAF